jgi:hypothetical protein
MRRKEREGRKGGAGRKGRKGEGGAKRRTGNVPSLNSCRVVARCF